MWRKIRCTLYKASSHSSLTVPRHGSIIHNYMENFQWENYDQLHLWPFICSLSLSLNEYFIFNALLTPFPCRSNFSVLSVDCTRRILLYPESFGIIIYVSCNTSSKPQSRIKKKFAKSSQDKIQVALLQKSSKCQTCLDKYSPTF